MCSNIQTKNTKRCGYVIIDTVTGQVVYTDVLDWVVVPQDLKTTTTSMSVRNHIGATKVIVNVASEEYTMMGKIKVLGVRK
jgi:hypothetical protein